MSSPIPPDPYQALGVLQDADISAIRSAHRKLVLKLHPDRIKDEAEKIKSKDEFQKVQQAYELLSDPDRRSRYDDRIKLAALRKEAMTRDSPMRSTSASYPMRPGPPPSSHSSRRDVRPDGNIYEERKPRDYEHEDYFGSRESFNSRDRYEEEPPRPSSRKYDGPGEKRSSTKTSESGKSKRSGWETGAAGMSVKMGLNLKKKASQARDRVQEKSSKEREKEKSAAKAKLRDQEQRKDRSEKIRRAYAEDDSSDSDTATQVTDATIRGPTIETVRPSMKHSPRSSMRREEPRRSSEHSQRHEDDDDEDVDEEYVDRWERRHQGAAEYISSAANRPTLGRSESSVPYWQNEDRSRRSGSDSDKRPTSSKGRRAEADAAKARPPHLPTHNSSPATLRHYTEERVPRDVREQHRSASGSTVPERDHRRETVPAFTRSKTAPSSRPTKKDTAPTKGSNLKHAETHDSGYGSSSSPHTPELSGTSPPRDSRESRREAPRTTGSTSTKQYKIQIVDPEEEDHSRSARDDDRTKRFDSPDRRSERPDRPRVVTSDRSKSSRVSSSKAESSSARPHDTRRDSGRRSARDSPPLSRHNSGRGVGAMFGEDFDEISQFSRQPESPKGDSYGRREAREDYGTSSRHRENLFSGSRRSPVDVRN